MKPDNNIKHLFSPWRMDYVSKPSSKEGDVFLDALNSDNDRESLILFRGALSFIIMNLYLFSQHLYMKQLYVLSVFWFYGLLEKK